jgi:hypothetical protein
MQRITSFAAIAVAIACVTACTAGTGETARPPAPDRTFVTGPSLAGPVDASYDYEPGSEIRYDLSVTQDISYEVVGDTSFLTSNPDPLPAEGRVTSRARTEIVYSVSESTGNQAATIGISAMFPEPETTAWADGEMIDPEIYDELTRSLATIQPIDFMVGVNDRNAVLTTGGHGGLDVLSGEVGALTNLSNNQISRPLGPVFPESRSLDAGDEWTVETTREGPEGPVVVSTSYEVTSLTEIGGAPQLSIEAATQTDGFDLDFSEIFRSLFAGFASGGDPVDESDLAGFADVVFAIGVQPSTGTAQYRFDVDRKTVTWSLQESTVRMVWILQTPDPVDGETTGFELDLEIRRRAEFDLIEE